jgi:hypothetical protein
MRLTMKKLALFAILFSFSAFAQSTGSPVPSTAQQNGGRDSSGNLLGVKVCDQRIAIAQVALNGSAQIIAGASSKKIYICGVHLISSAAVSVKFVESATSGNACATSPADVTGAASVAASGGFSLPVSTYAVPFSNISAGALCINTSGASTVGGWLAYTQQ